MIRRWLRRVSWVVLGLAGFFLNVESAFACSCMAGPTVMGGLERARSVVLVRITGFEAPATSNEFVFPDGIGTVKFVVETAYKGGIRKGETLEISQGQGGDCRHSYGREEVGRQYLFYLDSSNAKSARAPSACLRSAPAEYAADDLLYLNHLNERRGKTRVYGTLEPAPKYGGSVAGLKVHVTGKNGKADVTTDENGVYEAYGLPSGEYWVDLEAPPGWKVPPLYFDPDALADKTPRGIPVNLPRNGDAELNLRLEVDNGVRGVIRDAAGAPLKNVRLELVPVEAAAIVGRADAFPRYYRAALSNVRGEFAVDSVPDGSYILVVNRDGKRSGFEPFPAFYYPNTTDRSVARTFDITAGSVYDGLRVQPPEAEPTVTVTGRVLYSDGKPADWPLLTFELAKPASDVESKTILRPNAAGEFSISLLRGFEGTLVGSIDVYIGRYEKCPVLDGLLKKAGRKGDTIRTPELKITASEGLSGVDLRFPFPGCKLAKER